MMYLMPDAYKQIMANKHKLGYDEFTDPENFKTPNPEALDYAKDLLLGPTSLFLELAIWLKLLEQKKLARQ